ncbi:amidase [Nocardioides hungaricus]
MQVSGEPHDDVPSATHTLERLRSGEWSAVSVAEDCLRRLAQHNSRLNAVVAHDPELVLAQAREADVRRARGEEAPLLGVPVSVKDSLDAAGLPAVCGSWARRGNVPAVDATAVGRLRDAGAVILGKTNTPELCAAYETDNAVYGRTSNPHDPERTSGGSSGGEAVAVSTGMSLLGLGSDGGGSIRVPAHYCGVFGLRPTAGRVPETGQWPASRASGMGDMYCLGPLARSATDLALLLEVISGPDWVDPYAVPVPLRDWRSVEVGSLRVGVWCSDGVVDATTETVGAVRSAADHLAAAGAMVEEVSGPDTTEATELFFLATGGAGGADFLELVADCGDHHEPTFAAFLDAMTVRDTTSMEWFDIQRRFFDFRSRLRAWIRDFDVVLTPVVSGPAPRHGEPPAGVPHDEYPLYRAFNFTHTCSVAGLPAGVAPVAVADGLPIGVQIIASPWREDVVIAAAHQLERA